MAETVGTSNNYTYNRSFSVSCMSISAICTSCRAQVDFVRIECCINFHKIVSVYGILERFLSFTCVPIPCFDVQYAYQQALPFYMHSWLSFFYFLFKKRYICGLCDCCHYLHVPFIRYASLQRVETKTIFVVNLIIRLFSTQSWSFKRLSITSILLCLNYLQLRAVLDVIIINTLRH